MITTPYSSGGHSHLFPRETDFLAEESQKAGWNGGKPGILCPVPLEKKSVNVSCHNSCLPPPERLCQIKGSVCWSPERSFRPR